MPSSSGPNNVNDSIIFNYDIGDVKNSFLGRPTTNVNTHPLYIYNNVPGSVSSTLTATSETYRGATVFRQDLTALDGSGASWLSGCNNPGIGVYTYPGGGGNANQYSGHSIFFKPNVPMCSCPCYTHYSNIGGWQSTCNIEDMGDGWFRAYVLWYNTVTQSDGKFWAINPLTTAVGQTATIYWAGPFREDLNSTTISQFVNGTRSSTQSVLDLSPTSNILTVNNNPFTSPAINPQLNFDGIDDHITMPSSTAFDTQTVTVEVVVRPNGLSQNGFWFEKGTVNTQYSLFLEGGNIVWRQAGNSQYTTAATTMTNNAWNHVVGTFVSGDRRTYVNGTLRTSDSLSYTLNTNQGAQYIGSYNAGGYFYNGQIAVVKVYNRVLTAAEVANNYNEYKTRFNLP